MLASQGTTGPGATPGKVPRPSAGVEGAPSTGRPALDNGGGSAARSFFLRAASFFRSASLASGEPGTRPSFRFLPPARPPCWAASSLAEDRAAEAEPGPPGRTVATVGGGVGPAGVPGICSATTQSSPSRNASRQPFFFRGAGGVTCRSLCASSFNWAMVSSAPLRCRRSSSSFCSSSISRGVLPSMTAAAAGGAAGGGAAGGGAGGSGTGAGGGFCGSVGSFVMPDAISRNRVRVGRFLQCPSVSLSVRCRQVAGLRE